MKRVKFIGFWSLAVAVVVIVVLVMGFKQTLLAKVGSTNQQVKKAYSDANKLMKQGKWSQAKPELQKAIKLFKKLKRNQRRGLFKQNRMATHTLKIFDLLKSVVGKPYNDGTYTGAARGVEGQVKVSVTVAEGKISSVKVTQQKESRSRTSLKEIPKRIVKTNSLLVDAVTGATISSNAVREATAKALKQGVVKEVVEK